MKLKGDYSSNTAYSVGDVVRFTDGEVYLCQKAGKKGTPCVDTLYWGRPSQIISEIVKLCMDAIDIADSNDITLANNLTTTAAGKGLDARQGKALKGLVDGVAEDLADLNPNTKTLRLASSTADSTKLFDITVDDDGELTATEYTPAEEAT